MPLKLLSPFKWSFIASSVKLIGIANYVHKLCKQAQNDPILQIWSKFESFLQLNENCMILYNCMYNMSTNTRKIQIASYFHFCSILKYSFICFQLSGENAKTISKCFSSTDSLRHPIRIIGGRKYPFRGWIQSPKLREECLALVLANNL